MSHYFLSIHDWPDLIPESGSRDISDLAAAVEKAEALARDVAKQLTSMNRPLTARVEIRNDAGEVVASIAVLEAISPKLSSKPH